jgi:regulator of replication initiation timing
MSDQQEQPTIDDIWINRLAQKIGVLTAQNERLMLENEALQQQLQQQTASTNGEYEGAIT